MGTTGTTPTPGSADYMQLTLLNLMFQAIGVFIDLVSGLASSLMTTILKAVFGTA